MARFDRDPRRARRGWPPEDFGYGGDYHVPTYPVSERVPVERGFEYGARGLPEQGGYPAPREREPRRYRAGPPGYARDYARRGMRPGGYPAGLGYDVEYGGRPAPGPVWSRGRAEPTDEDVREAVRENLFQDTWVDPRGIEVRVDGGVVTLTGEVRDFMEARYAWDDAWESDGVRGVINNLTVRTSSEPELPQTGGDETRR